MQVVIDLKLPWAFVRTKARVSIDVDGGRHFLNFGPQKTLKDAVWPFAGSPGTPIQSIFHEFPNTLLFKKFQIASITAMPIYPPTSESTAAEMTLFENRKSKNLLIPNTTIAVNAR